MQGNIASYESCCSGSRDGDQESLPDFVPLEGSKGHETALVQQQAPDARSAALIALLHALRCEHQIFDPRPYGLSKRQLRAQAEEIAKSSWASEAIRSFFWHFGEQVTRVIGTCRRFLPMPVQRGISPGQTRHFRRTYSRSIPSVAMVARVSCRSR